MSVLARLRRHLGRGDQQQTTTHSEAVCLARAILSALQQDLAKPSNLVLDTEQACVDVWTQAASCDCAFLHLIRTRRKYSQKRLNFKDCEQGKELLKSFLQQYLPLFPVPQVFSSHHFYKITHYCVIHFSFLIRLASPCLVLFLKQIVLNYSKICIILYIYLFILAP